MPKNNKSLPKVLLILVLIGAVGGYIYLKSPQVKQMILQNRVLNKKTLSATVTYITGNLWKIEDGRKIQLLEQDVLSEGDEIATDANSRAVLLFDEGSVVRLDENTELILESTLSSNITIKEKTGLVFSRVQKDENHKFVIKAGMFSIESLGTSFSVENEDEVNVKVFESKVKVKSTFGGEKEVEENEEWVDSENVVKPMDEEDLNDDFLSWSLEKDKTEEIKKVVKESTPVVEEKTVKEEETTPASTGIHLSGEKADDGIFVSWSTNLSASKGFKIVKSKENNPTFPEDGYIYVSDSSVRNYKLSLKDGSTYHIRVCRYLGDGKCDNYSNEVVVTAPKVTSGEKSDDSNSDVDSISLEVSKKSDSSVKLEWSVNGDSDKGFKVVWSKNSGPTYPTRKGDHYHYLSDDDTRDDTVKDLDEDKKYYFRVCEYLGGKCGTYSNEVSIEL